MFRNSFFVISIGDSPIVNDDFLFFGIFSYQAFLFMNLGVFQSLLKVKIPKCKKTHK